MKRIMLFVSIFFITVSLSACSGTEYENLLNTNEDLQSEVDALQSGHSQLLEKENEILALLEDIQSQLDLQDGVNVLLQSENSQLLEKESTILALLEDVQTLLDLQGVQLDNSDVIQVEHSDALDAIQLKLDVLSIKLVQAQIDLYLEFGDYSEEFVSFFNSKTDGLIENGMTSEEIIAKFNSEYSIDGITALNEDLSTSSVITINKPSEIDFDSVNISIYYRGALLETATLYAVDEFTFAFDAPNYGLYTFEAEIIYQEVTFVESFDFGVTSSHYDMAFLNATKPVLMYTADLITNQADSPTFIQIVRLQTFNWEKLPENTYEFPSFVPNNGLITDGIDALSNWIYELYQADNESTFSLNIVDNYTGIAIVAFDRYHIPEANWDVNIWTDGAFTEYTLNTYTSATILNDRISFIENYRKEAFNVPAESIDYDYVNANVNLDALAYAASLDNVNYYTDGLSGITVTDQTVLDTIDAEITVKTIPDLFDGLKASGNIDEFEYLLNTRWGEEPEDSMSYYFDSPKGQYVLILGTSPAGEISNSTNKYFTFDEYLQQVIDLYGDEYEVFYKGHPAYPSTTERQALFESKGIVELEKTIPVEVLMYIYPNVYIGGYSGSSFYSSQDGQTLFFYGTEAFVRGRATLADMMDNSTYFDNTVFLFDETK